MQFSNRKLNNLKDKFIEDSTIKCIIMKLYQSERCMLLVQPDVFIQNSSFKYKQTSLSLSLDLTSTLSGYAYNCNKEGAL